MMGGGGENIVNLWGHFYLTILPLSRHRIGLESLLEHFIFLNFLGGGPPNHNRKERLLPINIHTIKFQTPDLQIIYTPPTPML